MRTHLVADLQTKADLQEQMLNELPCLPETAVMRASEFWRQILKIYFSDVQLVSPQFLTVWLYEWLNERNVEWAKSPGSSQQLLSYLNVFLPVLARGDSNEARDSSASEKMQEWLSQNPDAVLRWGHWFYLCREAWDYLRDHGVLLAQWVPAVLAGSSDLPDDFWPYDLVVNLGPALTGVEAELFEKLRRAREVSIVLPDHSAIVRHPETFAAYEFLAGALSESCSPLAPKTTVHRLASALAEVKAAVHWLREAADQGVPLDKIGIFSSNIETYWPLLESYMRVEGLPVRKSVVSSAQSLPQIQNWLARLRIEARHLSTGDLETVVFANDQAAMAYETFAPLFRKIYDENDLSREASIRRLFSWKFHPSEKIDRQQFFAWALSFWNSDANAIDRVAAIFLQECDSQFRLEVRSWLRYIENLVARIEIKNTPEEAGVHCGNFDGALHLQLDTVVLLGLDSDSIRPPEQVAILESDREKLSRDLGIILNSRQQDWSYWIEKIISQTSSRAYACFALHDLMSRPQSPSAVWLELAKRSDESGLEAQAVECESPGLTRWDEIQNAINETSNIRVTQDCGRAEHDKISIESLPKLSASQIEKYLACPFQFAAEKLFRLSDLPDIDLDIDALTNGRMIHEIVNRLLESPLRWNWKKEELAELVDQVRTQLRVVAAAESLWPATREKLVDTASQFLEFEKSWRAQFPETETVLREGKLQGHVSWLDGDDFKTEVTGRVDRVDRNAIGQYVVLDYKSSGSGLHNFGSWFENDELQLLFYSYCIEQGLTSLPPGPVLGAFYFTMNDMKRDKGFRDGGAADNTARGASTLFEVNVRGKSVLSRSDLEKLYQDLREKIAGVVTDMKSGKFEAKPKELKTCENCNWRTLCRAPHLN